MAAPPSAPLSRELGPVTTTLLVVGQVIAVGIFLTPAAMVRDLIAPAWVLAVWVLMGGMAVCGALVFGELASRYPQAGGVYVYLREAWGPRVAFLYGWKCFLVMDPGLTAALAAGLTSYLPYVVAIGPRAQLGAGIAIIVGLALINIAGVRLGARVMKITDAAAARRAASPGGRTRRVHRNSATTPRRARPLVSRCENSISVAVAGWRGKTSPLQRGQWLPHPAPLPDARTYAPHRMTAML